MRRAAKVDANQAKIVQTLRAIGASVAHLHALGKGVPDILVGYHGKNYLIEIKDGLRKPSERRLTKDEQAFADEWRGQVGTAHSTDEALAIVGAVVGKNYENKGTPKIGH